MGSNKSNKLWWRVEGTGRIKMRNRRFLRKAEPYQSRQPGPGPEIVKGPVLELLRAALV